MFPRRARPMQADKVFKALGDPTRRKLLDLLCEKNGQTLGPLCETLDMPRQSATPPLGMLETPNRVPRSSVARKKYISSTPCRSTRSTNGGYGNSNASGSPCCTI